MPHKHRRGKSKDASHHDLPPTTIARPLAATKASRTTLKRSSDSTSARSVRSQRKKKDGKDNFAVDDTPKAFARLMQFQANGRYPSGLDDGATDNGKAKKRKRATQEDTVPVKSLDTKNLEGKETPKILPGEKLSDFGARVNMALPVSGLAGKGRGASKLLGIKERQTKLEKKMKRMQEEWRNDERRIREKREEEIEDEDTDGWLSPGPYSGGRVTRKKKGKGRSASNAQDEEDIWDPVRLARNEAPRTLHDVVKAPPKFLTVPKNSFRTANGARVNIGEVPKAAGSLRRREQLGLARREVLDSYRKIMEGRTINPQS